MSKIPSLFFVAKKELFTPLSLFATIGIAILYILFSLFSLNYQLLISTLYGTFGLSYKVAIIYSLLLGYFTAFSPLDMILTILSALLVGANLVLVGKTIYLLEHMGKVRVSVGGATFLALVTTGCTSCGFSILSILGLSGTVTFLPFKGTEVHILSLFLLLFSSWYMVKKLRDGVYCRRK